MRNLIYHRRPGPFRSDFGLHLHSRETGRRREAAISPVGCRIACQMSLPSKQAKSPAEGDFLFELDPEPLEETLTAYGGIPLFLRAARSLDVAGSVKRYVHVKERQPGFDEASYVESFLVLTDVRCCGPRSGK